MHGEYPSEFHTRMYLLQDSDSEFKSVLCLNFESAQWRDRGLCAQQISSYVASSVTLIWAIFAAVVVVRCTILRWMGSAKVAYFA